MEQIHLNFNPKFWSRSNSPAGYIRGTAFVDGDCLQGTQIIEQLPEAAAPEEHWENALTFLNGFWSIVCHGGNYLVAAVDRIRSIPIFYGQSHGQVYLSDDAEWVRRKVGDDEMDPVARDEFQLAGYVTGQDTLFPNVKQLQAGEMLRINCTGVEPELETSRYYRFTHTEPENWDEPTLRKELDRVTETSIQRLIEYANGRQIVVPLSGGYDSRLIVTMLKRLGYKNILAFTYGVPGNKESEYSRKVADVLGVKWHFVEYSKVKWREAWQTDERWEYQRWGSGWSGLPHVQDWLAVNEMKHKQMVDKDCIFVPGHTGDFISGGHIPKEATPHSNGDINLLCYTIIRKHYGLAPWSKITYNSKQFWHCRIEERSEKNSIANGIELADAFEKWEWQERQAKFICNSVRVYDFFGYDWWMPLWDAEFMEFWQNVPLELRKDKKWYVDYVKRTYNSQVDENEAIDLCNASDKRKFFPFLSKLVKKLSPKSFPLLRHIYIVFYNPISKHHLCSYSKFSENEVMKLLKKGYTLNGINALMFLTQLGDINGIKK